MRKLLLIPLFCVWSIADDMPNCHITPQNLDSFKELTRLEYNMGVFYVMNGVVDGKDQNAYLEIFRYIDTDKLGVFFRLANDWDRVRSRLSGDLVGTNNGNFEIIGYSLLDPDDLFLWTNDGNLVVASSIDFSLIQDCNAKINKIYYVESRKKEILKNANGEELTYSNTIRKPIILDSALPNVDKLNKSISGATSINELRQELESYLKKRI